MGTTFSAKLHSFLIHTLFAAVISSTLSCSKSSISGSSAGQRGTRPAVSSPQPSSEGKDSISKTLDKDNHNWKSDYQNLDGFAIDVPPSELSTKNILIKAELKGSELDFSLLVTGDRQLSTAVSVTLPKSMLTSVNGLSMDKVKVTITPTDIDGNVTGNAVVLSSSDYGKIGNGFIISLSTWGVIKVGKTSDSDKVTTTPTAITIASIAPTIASGSYNVGDTISLAVTFSEAVTVTGTPKLNLNFGAPAQASYLSGSGTTALIFSYTIASGDNIDPLDYASNSALVLNSGSIKNSAGTAATLTLSAPGSSGSIAAASTITVDTTAPVAPTLTGATLTNNTQPSLSWTSGGTGNGTYRYKMDNSDLSSGTTSIATTSMSPSSALTDGPHTLYVQEGDAAGNWSSTSSFAFTIDTNMPGAPSVTSTASTSTNNRPTWTWTSGGNGGSGYRYKLDNSTLTSGATTTTATTYTPASALADGPHTLYVQEVNGNGSWSDVGSYVVTIDTIAPNAPLVTSAASSSANNQPTWTWTSGGNGGNTHYRVKLEDNNMAAGTTALTVGSFTPASPLSDGAHILYVQERDAAGNWSALDSYSITIDTTAPTAPNVSGTATVNNATPTWTWTAGTGGNGTFRYKLDNNDLTSGATTVTSPAALTYTAASNLTEAAHTLYVQERDAIGNWSNAGSFSITVDLTPPSVDAGADLATGTQFTRTATVTGATTYQWSKTSGSGTVTFGSATAASTTISADTTSSFVIRLTATDSAGNSAYDELTLAWTQNDGVAPGVPTLDIASKIFNSSFTVTATQSTGDADFTEFRYTTSGTAPADCSSGTATSGAITISATTTLKVVACDAGGNISATVATGTYTLDTTSPLAPSLDISTKVFNANFTVTASQNATTDANFLEYRYTTTGTAPTSCSNGTATSGAISITGTSNVTLKVIACDAAGNASSATTGAYVYNNSTPLVPSLDISSKVFNSNFTVTVSENATPDAGFVEFRYTTTGTAPTGCSDGTATSGAISITGTSNITLKVITCNSVGNASSVATGTYTYDNTVPLTPSLDISSKAFNGDFSVTASQNATNDANFLEYRYTTTGTAPTSCSNGTATSGAISITGTSNLTLKVIACDAAGNASASAVTAIYTYDNTAPLTPSIDISTKTFGSNFTVTASQNATTDANFLEYRYTTTGTAPTSCSNGAATSDAIIITGTSNVTLKVIACDSAGNYSSAVTGNYTYSNSTPLTPSIDISSKVFNSNFTVTASQNATPDAGFVDFRYTTTGTAPTGCSDGSSSSGSISITGTNSVTLKVIACNSIGNYSPVVTGTYTYDNTAPLTPSLDISSKVFNANFTVTASQNATTDANFLEYRYTTTGTAPTSCSNGTSSSGAISITGTSNVTLKVIACDSAGNASSAVTGTYTYDGTAPLTPSLDITSKVFNASFTATAVQNATTDANFLEFRYTTTGTAPTSCSNGTASNGSISITGTSNITLKVIACDSAGNASSTVTGTYTYDGTPPTVTNVTSNKADGTYGTSEVIDIRVTFSEAVAVTGTPYITLETGTTDRNATYSSGSESTTLVFNYTVQSGDASSDLTYTATSALALNGGTIKDSASNDATLALASPSAAGSLASNNALVISTATAPGAFTISSVGAASTQLTVTWGSSSGATSYTLKRGTSSGTYPITVSSAATSPYVDTGLTNGTPYYYMVTAVNAGASTDATAQGSGTPVGSGPYFTSIDLAGRAADGTLNYTERWSAGRESIVGNLIGGNYVKAAYYVTGTGTTCSSIPYTSYSFEATPNDANFGADGNYKVCVVLLDANYDTGYGESSTITLDTTVTSGNTVLQVATNVNTTGKGNHTCAIMSDYRVKCWGYNDQGQLGYDLTNYKIGALPGDMTSLGYVNLGTSRTAKAIATGGNHTCAILDNDFMKCWGLNSSGQLGYDSTTNAGNGSGTSMAALSTVNLGASRTAKAVSAGDEHTCAILDDDSLKCWGNNANGRLGYDSTTNKGTTAGDMAALATVNLGTGRTAKAIAAGAKHTCAVLDDNTEKCWGYNSTGQLGYDVATDKGTTSGHMAALAAINIGSGRTAKFIAAGSAHSCVITDNDNIICWGSGSDGRLGRNSTGNFGATANSMASLTAINIGTGRTAKALASGGAHNCVILDTNAVKCWGQGYSGQLGCDSPQFRGNSAVDSSPANGKMATACTVNLGTGRTATKITAGSSSTCAVLDNGALKCWGDNGFGQLGHEDTISKGNSTVANSMDGIAAINLGTGRTAKFAMPGYDHACAILDDDTAKCWGQGTQGQLGQGTTTTYGGSAGSMASLAPINLGAGRTAKMLRAGYRSTCFLLDDGSVKCTGDNAQGELGVESSSSTIGTATSVANHTAVNLGAGRTAKSLAGGYQHYCAILDNDSLKCWGYNGEGQLGIDSSTNKGSSAGDMASLTGINLGTGRTAKKVSAGGTLTCVILDNNSLKCFGRNNYGQLGTNNLTTAGKDAGSMAALGTVNLGTGRTAKSVSAGVNSTCVILDTDAVKCFGLNAYGQLGLDSTTDRGGTAGDMDVLPTVNLGTGRTAKQITTAAEMTYGSVTCALLDNDTVICWGAGRSGVLSSSGQGSYTPIGSAPGDMSYVSTIKSIGFTKSVETFVAGRGTCAVSVTGAVRCWGHSGFNGQDAASASRGFGTSVTVPIQVYFP